MDELNRKLEDILNDPASMDKVRQMAQSILGDDEPEKDAGAEQSSSFNAADMGRIMGILGKLNTREDDNRAKLLLALKPHLTQRRREKVDTAVKLLKLIEALPLLKEAGIFDFGG